MQTEQNYGYRECLISCRENGQAMPFSFEEFSKEKVVQQIREHLKKENEGFPEEMLWLKKRDEQVTTGLYSWNCPSVDLAITGTPFMLAFAMGEYVLAREIWKKQGISLEKEWISELYQVGHLACIGGGSYCFTEAFLLSEDLPEEEKEFFYQIACFEAENPEEENRFFLEDFQFHRAGELQKADRWRPIAAVQKLYESGYEKADMFFVKIVEYLLNTNMDLEYDNGIQQLFLQFPDRQKQNLLIQTVHEYFCNFCPAENLPPRQEERFQNILEVYFQWNDALETGPQVNRYLYERICSPLYFSGKKKRYLDHYLKLVKSFEGNCTPEWEQGVYKVLEKGSMGRIALCFQNHFLRKEEVEEYIEHLLEKGTKVQKSYIVPYLIRLKWKEKPII